MAEREQGGFDGFLLAPVDRTALFVAKAAVLFVLPRRWSRSSPSPAFAILLLGPVAVAGAARAASLVLRWPTSGIAVVGTLVARARRSRPARAT